MRHEGEEETPDLGMFMYEPDGWSGATIMMTILVVLLGMLASMFN